MRNITTLGWVFCFAATATAQSPGNIQVMQIHYETVVQRGDDERIYETGVISTALDGRRRVEVPPIDGEPIIEIRNPGQSAIYLHPSDNKAYVTQHTQVPFMRSPEDTDPQLVPGVGLDALNKKIQERKQMVFTKIGNIFIGENEEALGVRSTDGINLEGVREVTVLPNGDEMSSETWFYYPQDPSIEPIIAEFRIEGQGVVEHRRIVSIDTQHVSNDYFGIPENYQLVDVPLADAPRPRIRQ